MAIRRIGQIFVDLGFIDDDQLDELIVTQEKRPNELIGKIAQDLGLINEEQLAQALAEQMSLQVVSLDEAVIPPEVLSHVTEPMAQLYRIIPIAFRDNTLTVAMCDPQKLSIQDELRTFLGYDIRPVVATERDIKKALDRYYTSGTESMETLIDEMAADADLAAAAESLAKGGGYNLTDEMALVDSAPVRKLLNMALGFCRHHAHQSDGQPGHCGTAHAPGRPDRADRRRPPR